MNYPSIPTDIEEIVRYTIQQWSSPDEKRHSDHEDLVNSFIKNDLPEFVYNQCPANKFTEESLRLTLDPVIAEYFGQDVTYQLEKNLDPEIFNWYIWIVEIHYLAGFWEGNIKLETFLKEWAFRQSQDFKLAVTFSII